MVVEEGGWEGNLVHEWCIFTGGTVLECEWWLSVVVAVACCHGIDVVVFVCLGFRLFKKFGEVENVSGAGKKEGCIPCPVYW